jgi:hypothetical protein
MQGIAEAIKYLYQQFILRDVVAYVTPGTILTVCALMVYLGTMDAAFTFIKAIPTVAYIPIYGFLFITGLGIQNLGEFLRVLPEHDRLADSKRKLSRDQVRFEKLQEFHRATFGARSPGATNDYADALERTRERIEVKKYASGNIAAAIVLSAILVGIREVSQLAGRWAIVGIAAIVVACLVRAHHRQMKNVTTWEDDAINAAKVGRSILAQTETRDAQRMG